MNNPAIVKKAVEILGSEFKARKAVKGGITRGADLYTLRDLLKGGEVRTGYYQGSGRNTKAVDTAQQAVLIAHKYGRECITGNDAPRGGVSGNWVKMLSDVGSKKARAKAESLNTENARIRAEWEADKMRQRADAIAHCLNCNPVEISQKNGEICETANLSDSQMIEVYKGCGKGTAYLRGSNVVAWHYGYQQPDNVPTDVQSVAVVLSCTQICFL